MPPATYTRRMSGSEHTNPANTASGLGGSASRDTDRLVKVLKRHHIDHVIDIGANEGQFGRRLRQGGYGGHILSVEPIPAVRETLMAAGEGDAKWAVAPAMALGAEKGTATLTVSEATDMSSLAPLTRQAEAMLGDTRQSAAIEVTVTTLDDAAPKWLDDTAHPALKIDTQGTELDVLRGGRRVMDRFIVVILELSLVPLYQGEPDWRTVCDAVAALGYDPVLFLPGYFNKATARMVGMDGVFVRRDRLDRRLG